MNTAAIHPVPPTPPLQKETTVGNYFVSNYPPYSFWKPERIGELLAGRLQATAGQSSRRYASGVITYEEYYPARAKELLDEIDRVLARHYGFSEQEVDYILHYEIKYRMGRDQASRPPA